MMIFLDLRGDGTDQNMCLYSSQMKTDKGYMYGKRHGQLVPVLLVVLSWPMEMMQG